MRNQPFLLATALFLVAVVLIAFFTGQIDIWQRDLLYTGGASELAGLTFSPHIVDAGNHSYTFTLDNQSGHDLQFGSFWHLEVKRDDGWQRLEFVENAAFDLLLYALPNGGQAETHISLNMLAERLASGAEYRLTKTVALADARDSAYAVTVTFTME